MHKVELDLLTKIYLHPLLQLCSPPSPVLWQVPHYFLFISILFQLLTVNLMVDLAVITRLISRLIMIELKRLVIWLIWVWSHRILRWSLVWSQGDPIVSVRICFLFTFPQWISWLNSRWSLDWSQDLTWSSSKDWFYGWSGCDLMVMSRWSLGWSHGDPMFAVGARNTAMET